MNKLTIDPEKFALALLHKEKPAAQDNESFIKAQLLLYLEAAVAADNFNKLEDRQFNNMKENEIKQIINDIMGARLNA